MRSRALPIGAEIVPGQGVHLRVWAPRRRRVDVVLEDEGDDAHRLEPEPGGYFAGLIPGAGAGTLYRFRLDDDETLYADPASRFQPDGPHGPSQVVDPSAFRWTDAGWRGVPADRRVVYELHIGTFTAAGTWAGAAEQLPALAELGVTLLEVMPVAEFPGRFGWGYDGVDLFAPTRLYGTPDDFRAFVDRAHGLGLGVVLDVVYNHLGPDGNVLPAFSDRYFTDRYETDWGEPLNFDGPDAGPVREYVLANVEYWVREFHLDGLRLDATQSIFDAADAGEHIVAAIARRAREAAGDRVVYLIGENEPQRTIHVRPPDAGGYGLDALWNDDWHHSAIVALTGRKEAYYSDHFGAPQEFVSAAKYGYLYQGQNYAWQGARRGTPALDLPPAAFINFLQNHDQVANSARGDRIHRLTSPGQLRAMTALLLLGPATPMLFMGQEFAASAPFLYFADHRADLARLVQRGRTDFLRQFPSIATPDIRRRIDQAADPGTFRRCILDHTERERHAEILALHRDLIRLRHQDPTLGQRRSGGLDGAVLGRDAFLLRFFATDDAGTDDTGTDDTGTGRAPHGDRLLIVNLGRELPFSPAPEPLLAPPHGLRWTVRWSSEDPAYGGLGHAPPEADDGSWNVPGHAAVLLAPAS